MSIYIIISLIIAAVIVILVAIEVDGLYDLLLGILGWGGIIVIIYVFASGNWELGSLLTAIYLLVFVILAIKSNHDECAIRS